MRQRTLVRLLLASCSLIHARPPRILQAPFFTMPPGIRPAPPQQASLSEFWKKGKGKHTAAKVEKTEDKMDVDIEGTHSAIRYTRVAYAFAVHSAPEAQKERVA